MSLSISSFESARIWRRFVVQTLFVMVGITIAMVAALVAIDPYDSGVMSLVTKQGVTVRSPRLSDASRVHDESFDAALFGNSHVITISPARLSQSTGLAFAMLAVPGTGVPEQMAMLDAYLARHSTPKALILSLDGLYCNDDPHFLPPVPFPFWLYASDRLAYIRGLARMTSLDAAGQRLAYVFGFAKARRRDGVIDMFEGLPAITSEAAATTIAATSREVYPMAENVVPPGLAMLEERLGRLDPSTRVVLFLPPVAAQTLPFAGTPAGERLQRCRADIQRLAATHPNTQVVDWHKDTPETADIRNFWDSSHYYDRLAARVEVDLVAALKAGPDGR